MNKKEFIEIFSQNADFLSEDELESAKIYLNTRLEDEIDCKDAATFASDMKLSFEVFKYLEDVEAERHLSALGNSISQVIDSVENDAMPEEKEKEEVAVPEPEPIPEPVPQKPQPKPRKDGLVQKIFSQKGASKTAFVAIGIFALILLSPIFAAIAALCAVIYIVPAVAVLAIWLAIMVAVAASALLGIIALSYGIANIFITPPIGLMEIGLGTVLFSFMLALWALDFQFIATLMPFSFKKITKLLSRIFNKPKDFIFGKKA